MHIVSGATIIDGLDTLYVMNLTERFQRGRKWVEMSLDIKSIVRKNDV